MKKDGIENYRYGVPLQLPSQRLFSPTGKEVNVLGQEEAMHQTLGNLPPFTLPPCSNIGRHWLRLVTEFESSLPTCLGLRGKWHVGPDLGSGLRTTSRLQDCDPTGYPRRGPRESVTRNPWCLVGSAMPFYVTAGRRKGSQIPALGLVRLSCREGTRQKPIDGHCTLGHHLVALTDLHFRRINWLSCC